MESSLKVQEVEKEKLSANNSKMQQANTKSNLKAP